VAHHLVSLTKDQAFSVPPPFEGRSSGYSADTVLRESSEAVHIGFQISILEPDGHVDTHLHSFEESLYIVDGDLVVDTAEGSVAMTTGDYGLLHAFTPHAFRNVADRPVRFAEQRSPMPRQRLDYDTAFVPAVDPTSPIAVDPRDPRTKSFGHIDPENSDPAMQTQDRLALSASMRTALLVYSGITVKMMVDSDLGAHLHTMFMVRYVPGGFAGPHDHPFEESYLILEGEVESRFDGTTYMLGPGDFAWAGVGCVHEFSNVTDQPVRWLETSSPGPPTRHAYRFRRDWTYLGEVLES
jgi:quercetin dioxygenase-like cupin family protein